MPYMTLDGLAEQLQRLKLAGFSGDTPVVIPSLDNNRSAGWMQRIDGVGRGSVAKSDMDKNYALCKQVASRGVEVLVIR